MPWSKVRYTAEAQIMPTTDRQDERGNEDRRKRVKGKEEKEEEEVEDMEKHDIVGVGRKG